MRAADRVSGPGLCLGWRYAAEAAEVGPPPRRPAAQSPLGLDPAWVAAQARIAWVLGRPVRLGGAACVIALLMVVAARLVGLLDATAAWFGTLATLTGASAAGWSLWRARRRLGAVLAAERHRIRADSAEQARWLAAGQREHMSGYRAWQRRRVVLDRQPRWFAVSLPADIDRVDVAGGTLAGWSALLTTTAAPRLAAGGEVAVIDLTQGAVAADLIAAAMKLGLRPLVWLLPADLANLDLGTGLSGESLADVLAVAARASASGGAAGDDAAGAGTDAADCALLERVLEVLEPDPRIASVNAALRALAQVGDPRADLRSRLITIGQFDQLSSLFGRGALDRVVTERAFILESKLRALDQLGAAPVQASSRLRVVALDRGSGAIANRIVGAYVVAALTHMLRTEGLGSGAGRDRTICLVGAERLAAPVLDRLADACELSSTGLVIAYRSIPAWVRERLGRGNAAIAFMRLGNGDEARAASDLIGTEHRFVVSQLTDTLGTSVTDTWGGQYTSTVGTADSVADSFSVSRSQGGSRGYGRSEQQRFGPFGDFNRTSSRDSNYSDGDSASVSLTEGINTGTSWGLNLSRALSANSSLGRTAQRSRELLVEPDELQRLPPTAAIISYPASSGRMVALVDTNPAIMALPGVAAADGEELDDDEER